MKNKAGFLIPIFIILICMIGIAVLLSGGGIEIETFDSVITIDENGDMLVSETWVVNWPEDMHVSFRDIGYQKYHENNPLYQDRNNKAMFNTDSVSVKVYDSNGLELAPNRYQVGFSFNGDLDERGKPIQCEPYRTNCESIFVYVPAGMEEQMTFKYQYKIIGAVTKYNDIAELNWRIVDYFEKGISSSKVVINLPNVLEKDIQAWGHGLSQGKILLSDNKVTLDMKNIKANEFVEFRVLFPASSVSVDEINFINLNMKSEIEKYEANEAAKTNMRITVAQVILYGTFVMVAVMIFITYQAYVKYDKEYTPAFNAKYFRELPAEYSPAEMSYLYYFRKINDEDVTATLLDLIRRKYLILDTVGESVNEKDPNFKIILNKDENLTNLLVHERHLIDWFINDIGDGTSVSIKQIENYPKGSYQKAMRFNQQAKDFVNKAKEAGKKHDFFEKKISSQKSKLYTAGLIPVIYLFISFATSSALEINNFFAIIISLITLVVYFIYISTIDKRSINGNEEYAKWKAFKNFLEDFGRMKDYPMPGVVVWEHYLVYATSLKIADKVMEQLKVRLPNLNESTDLNNSTFMWFGYRYYGFHYGYALSRINTSINTARYHGNATISAHNATRVSGGGRGGGFSGGSSFGGGGGGFRGR